MFGGTLEDNNNLNDPSAYDITCFRCGTCCSRYQPRLSFPEAQVLAEKLNIQWNDFIHQYIDPRWPGTQSFLIQHRNNACMFLTSTQDGKQHLCSIHSFKPACCREWQSGLDRPECRQGLLDIWGLTVDLDGNITGPQDKIILFKNYISNL